MKALALAVILTFTILPQASAWDFGTWRVSKKGDHSKDLSSCRKSSTYTKFVWDCSTKSGSIKVLGDTRGSTLAGDFLCLKNSKKIGYMFCSPKAQAFWD